jgi:hypothetical protein
MALSLGLCWILGQKEGSQQGLEPIRRGENRLYPRVSKDSESAMREVGYRRRDKRVRLSAREGTKPDINGVSEAFYISRDKGFIHLGGTYNHDVWLLPDFLTRPSRMKDFLASSRCRWLFRISGGNSKGQKVSGVFLSGNSS